MIGNTEYAHEIARLVRNDMTIRLPWRHIGSGRYRNAWLHTDEGVIYKTAGDDEKSQTMQRAEVERIRLARKIPGMADYCPSAWLWQTDHGLIVAMEYVESKRSRTMDEDEERAARAALHEKFNRSERFGRDWGRRNIRWQGDQMVIIDWGNGDESWRPPKPTCQNEDDARPTGLGSARFDVSFAVDLQMIEDMKRLTWTPRSGRPDCLMGDHIHVAAHKILAA